MTNRRFKVLPPRGRVLVQTDVHGNLADFHRMRQLFFELTHEDPHTHWVILGDVIHGPDADSRRRFPKLWNYPDRSFRIVRQLHRLLVEHPDRIHFVLGNHEHSHVGGPTTSKFYPDEAARLRSTLTDEQHRFLVTFIRNALLAVATPCGVVLTHGAPGIDVDGPREIDELVLDESRATPRQRTLLKHLLRTYGQPREPAQRFLNSLNTALDHPQRVVLHGHDAAREGYFTEGTNQLCPCIFGAPDHQKRYTLLDLQDRYDTAEQLLQKGAVRHLYPEGT